MDSRGGTIEGARGLCGTAAARVVGPLVGFEINEAVPVTRAGQSHLGDGTKGRIVVAEDDEACRRLLVIRLSLCGFQVTEFEDGLYAWECLSRGDPELPTILVTDWRMPNCDGMALARRVRTTPHTGDIPIVLFSSDAPPLAEQVELSLHYVQKGTSWRDMELLIDRIWSARAGSCRTELPGVRSTAG